jgi:hypothetical protein
MFSLLPLDDQLNRIFYIDGALFRLMYDAPLGRCVLRREAPHIEFDHAVSLIAAGELLWNPPDEFDRLDADTSLEAVQQEHALLCAFLRSPAGNRVTSWKARRWIESRINEDRDWAARRMIARGDVDEPDDHGRRSG